MAPNYSLRSSQVVFRGELICDLLLSRSTLWVVGAAWLFRLHGIWNSEMVQRTCADLPRDFWRGIFANFLFADDGILIGPNSGTRCTEVRCVG